jgi:hypothetical protein
MLAKPFRKICLCATLNIPLDQLMHTFGANLQFLIHRLANAVAHAQVRADAKQGQHHGEDREVPSSQA